MRRAQTRAALVALGALIVLAGCAAPLDFGPREDPEDDAIGWENGYWHDESIAVTPEDGYNETEREAVVSRTMARLEEIRGLEFNRTVPVEVISREEYRDRNGGGGNESATYSAWNNQVWEGLFVVGEGSDFSQSRETTLGESVAGYYSPSDEQIVLVSDSETPTVDRGTLAHELVHALQDQQFGLDATPETQDRQLAEDGVVEGEANYLQQFYRQRCQRGWSCIPLPESNGNSSGLPDGYNRGLFLTVYQPYATGPNFVHAVRERSDWAGVDRLHENLPDSTEQVIHPAKYPDEEPANVTVPDRSNDEWQRFDHDPTADTVGEASIFAMFAYNDAIDVEGQDVYAYESAPSAGWGGDALVPYTTGENGTEDAYVWVTKWDTAEDAREFRQAYQRVLESHDAAARGENVYVIPDDSSFGDAFRVVREDRTVRIVNAPTVDQLDAVHDSSE